MYLNGGIIGPVIFYAPITVQYNDDTTAIKDVGYPGIKLKLRRPFEHVRHPCCIAPTLREIATPLTRYKLKPTASQNTGALNTANNAARPLCITCSLDAVS